jgi:hypothetical protein
MTITSEQEDFIEELLNETGFEIWNAECTHRLSTFAHSRRFAVFEKSDPLHALQEYDTFRGAINFLLKQDVRFD